MSYIETARFSSFQGFQFLPPTSITCYFLQDTILPFAKGNWHNLITTCYYFNTGLVYAAAILGSVVGFGVGAGMLAIYVDFFTKYTPAYLGIDAKHDL